MPTLALTQKIVSRILERFPEVELKHDRFSDETQDGNLNKYTTKVYVPRENSKYQFSRIVSTDLYVNRTEVQSTMIRVYGRSDNALPHLAFDIFQNAPDCIHVQIDLINRADLLVNMPYLKKCYEPLTHILERMRMIDGVVTQPIPFLQRALVSGYFFGYSISLDAIPEAQPLVMEYLEHWFSLNDMPAQEILDTLQERDRENLADYDKRARRSLMEMEMVWRILPVLIDKKTNILWTQLNLVDGDDFSVVSLSEEDE
jgi:hypothetical protein